MTALWARVVQKRMGTARLDDRGRPAAASAIAARDEVEGTLEAIGMRDETMRAQLDQIEQGLSQVERAREQFHELLTPLVELFADYETSRSRLHELKTKHAVLEDTHGALNARYGSALAERDTIAEVAAAEKRESRELRQRLQRAEAGLAAAQAEGREGVAAREKLERTLEAESRRMAAQSDEIGRLRAELAERDQNLARLESALKEANDQGALIAQDNASLRETMKSQGGRLEAALRRLAEYEATSDRDQKRLVTLEQALAGEQGAHATLRVKHIDQVERNRAESSALANSIHAVRGRVDVTNKLLEQTRGQFREKVEELRATDRRLMESGIQIDALEKTLRALKEDLAVANEQIAGADRMRGALVDQVNSLTEAVRSKESALQAATRNSEALAARVDDTIAATRRAREESERRASVQQEEIVRLRAERQLTDGALEASRSERQQARFAAVAALDGPNLFDASKLSEAPKPLEGSKPLEAAKSYEAVKSYGASRSLDAAMSLEAAASFEAAAALDAAAGFDAAESFIAPAQRLRPPRAIAV
jgi:chromosome segregation ATPase